MTTIAYKLKVYPDQRQLEILKQFAGCVRFVYNYVLALSKEKYEKEGVKWSSRLCREVVHFYLEITPQFGIHRLVKNIKVRAEPSGVNDYCRCLPLP